MRKFFMTDIHGDYKGLDLLLNHAEVDLNHDQLVFGGDMINRGQDSAGVVKRIKALAEKYPNTVHALVGNHEEMMGDYMKHGDRTWLSHGGYETIQSFTTMFPDEKSRQEHMEWACSLPLYFEDAEYVYTHAGLDPAESLIHQSRDILWMSEFDFYSIPRDELLTLTNGKAIVHGHTPVERIFHDGVRINCDMGSNTYSVVEERGLGIINLSEQIYYVFKPVANKIEQRKISRF